MITIHKLIPPECVLIHPSAESREALLRMMVDGLAAAGKTSDADQLYQDVLAREELASTALGFGCAVPHVHSETVERTAIAVAVINEALNFETPDDESVSLVILIAGPANKAGAHLKLLSKLARFLHDGEFRAQLTTAASAEDFINLIRGREDTGQ